MDDTTNPDLWYGAVRRARNEQVSEHGYDADHDDDHGIEHLILQSLEYIRKGEDVKAGAMILAMESWMKRHDYIKAGLL